MGYVSFREGILFFLSRQSGAEKSSLKPCLQSWASFGHGAEDPPSPRVKGKMLVPLGGTLAV